MIEVSGEKIEQREEGFPGVVDPHEAVALFRKNHPGFRPKYVMVSGSTEFEVVAFCETCGVALLSGDEVFLWEDCETCLKCGGDNASHKPSVLQ